MTQEQLINLNLKIALFECDNLGRFPLGITLSTKNVQYLVDEYAMLLGLNIKLPIADCKFMGHKLFASDYLSDDVVLISKINNI